ncbi:hypothetical protein PENTCL1PPCAC_15260 [Pristionchus entomophagus]|uniref:C6 domain-containing protein n=1 Tax=Pristionchus entomophagus TaxID=358040 RepID=A0AAV5TD36_9BILA|nr:hypothetical protein PENTCL1PPCAC_15260 [Pristionchus entomophagus]
MLASWLIFSLSIVISHCGSCEDWSQEDQINHECRACRDITVDDLANCPETSVCDETEPIRAAVLTASDTCRCQSLRCANKGWRLAVNGSIVDKVGCKKGQWFSSGVIASSFVCAKIPTDPGIPATPKPLICPKLEPANLPTCISDTGNGRCFEIPVIEEPTIRCPNTPPNTLYVRTKAGDHDHGNQELKCSATNKRWEWENGTPYEAAFVACINRMGGG